MHAQNAPQYIEIKTHLHPILKELLDARKVEDLNDYFSWNLKNLPDFSTLKDINKAAIRIIEGIENNEVIGVFGDYDVDGTTSCALLSHFFNILNYPCELFQPSRFKDGYGLHPSSIDKAIEKGVNILITVDCGITNNEAADYAKENHIDLIITDHHGDIKEKMPDAYAVVNPNRRDEDTHSPMRALAGVGVAFALCVEIKKEYHKKGLTIPSLYELLQYVAVGTISDLAPLNNMNKKLVRHGLKQLPQTKIAGFKTFLNAQETQLETLPSEKVSFYIGPHINSKGRLDHPDLALRLLLEKDYKKAKYLFFDLESCNSERKIIQSEVYEEAKDQILKNIQVDQPIHIVYEPHWHEGVIGIVASKIVESFEVPAIVFTDAQEQGVIKASCRSAGELNLMQALNECSDLFIKFGGHKAAAGLSMKKENLSKLRLKLNSILEKIPAISRTKQDEYDLYIKMHQIDFKLIRQLDQCEPFGMGNPKPVFRSQNVTIADYRILKDKHVKWTFYVDEKKQRKIQGISFNFIGKWKTLDPAEIMARQESENLIIQYSLSVNRFNGNETVQLMVDRVFFN